jgi:hypothetical protein
LPFVRRIQPSYSDNTPLSGPLLWRPPTWVWHERFHVLSFYETPAGNLDSFQLSLPHKVIDSLPTRAPDFGRLGDRQ